MAFVDNAGGAPSVEAIARIKIRRGIENTGPTNSRPHDEAEVDIHGWHTT